MKIPQDFLEGLNRDADIVAIIGEHVALSQQGKEHKGLCPFHAEKTPSFSVNPAKGCYHCFSCEAGGNTLQFLKVHVHGGDFLAAVKDLAGRQGKTVPFTHGAGGDSGKSLAIHEVLERQRDRYHHLLMTDDRARHARDYLKNERGFSKETVEAYRIGYAPADGGLGQVNDKRDRELLIEAGLLRTAEQRSPYPYFRDRVMFPIINHSGKVAGFGGRILRDGQPKYLNSPTTKVFDKGRIVFGLVEATAAIKEGKQALVVEGYMDVVSLAQHGVRNAVATMGTAATEPQLTAILTRAAQVVFCFDGDGAGRRAADKALANVLPVVGDGKDIRFAFLPQGTDPDEYIRQHQAEGFRNFLAEALGLAGMLLRPPEGEDTADLADETLRSRMCRNSALLIDKIDDRKAPFLKKTLFQQLAEASKLPVNVIKQATAQATAAAPRAGQAASVPRPTSPDDRRMGHHHAFQLLVCLAADAAIIDDYGQLLVYCGKKSKKDQLLCEKLLHSMHCRRGGDEPVDLLAMLKEMGKEMLHQQIKDQIDRRSRMKKPSPARDEAMKLVHLMREQKRKDDERRRLEEMMDDATATPGTPVT